MSALGSNSAHCTMASGSPSAAATGTPGVLKPSAGALEGSPSPLLLPPVLLQAMAAVRNACDVLQLPSRVVCSAITFLHRVPAVELSPEVSAAPQGRWPAKGGGAQCGGAVARSAESSPHPVKAWLTPLLLS